MRAYLAQKSSTQASRINPTYIKKTLADEKVCNAAMHFRIELASIYRTLSIFYTNPQKNGKWNAALPPIVYKTRECCYKIMPMFQQRAVHTIPSPPLLHPKTHLQFHLLIPPKQNPFRPAGQSR